MPLLDREPVEDTSLREVATRIAIPLVALVALFVASFFSRDVHRATRSFLIGLVFLAAFSTLVILMRFEMGRRRLWLAGALVAFAALLVAIM
jgi:lipopolysaccharide export LptBFGC system permease protein LptF